MLWGYFHVAVTIMILPTIGNINPKMEEDTIIGKWKLISVTEDNETELASNCEKKSII